MAEESSAGTKHAVARFADEAALVAALRAGDGDAYEHAVRQLGPRLLAVTRRLLHNEQDAQDAVQEAFLSAFRSIARFTGDSRLSTWLHRIAVNAALMKLRSARTHPELAIDDLQPRFLPDGHYADWPEPWREDQDVTEAEREETRAILRDAIARLPEAYRIVVTLRDLQGLSTEQAAEMLGDSVNAVKVRLHRARAALRTLLDARLGISREGREGRDRGGAGADGTRTGGKR